MIRAVACRSGSTSRFVIEPYMRSLLLTILAVLALAAAASAHADPRARPDRGRPEPPHRDYAEPRRGHSESHRGEHGMTMKEAASRAQRQHGGRVLSVDADDAGGYRVKLLKDGEVRTVFISP